MSYWRQIGKSRDARKLIKELVERINKLESQVNQIEIRDFTQIIRSNNDRIVFVDEGTTEINSIVLDPNAKNYQITFEPDGNKLSLWLKFLRTTSTGQYLDESGFGNSAVIDSGGPTAANGPVSGLPSLRFDGVDDLIAIPNNSTINLQTAAAATGFSINFNINPTTLTQHGSRNRIIACKTDDSVSARQWGWMIWMEPNGNLYFHVRIANIFYTASKSFAFPAVNRWYRVFCTFDRSTNTPRIYVDGNLSGEGTSTYTGGLTLPTSSTSLYIGGNDIAGQSHLSAFVSDFRFWREKVVTQTEIDNIQSNNYSIIFSLHPARIGVAVLPAVDNGGGVPNLPPPPPPPVPSTLRSFTNTSFTSTSFAPN